MPSLITPNTERLGEIKNRWKVVGGRGLFSPKPLSAPQETKAPFDIYFLLQTIQALQEENQILKEAVALMPALSVMMSERTLLTAALEKIRVTAQKSADMLINLQPHIPISCYPSHMIIIDEHVDFAMQSLDTILSDIDSVLPPSKPSV